MFTKEYVYIVFYYLVDQELEFKVLLKPQKYKRGKGL